MFKRKQKIKHPKEVFDEQLLSTLNAAKLDWDRAKQNQEAV